MGNAMGLGRTEEALKEQREALIYGVKKYDPKNTQSFEEQLPETSAIKGLDNNELAALLENLLKEADTYEKAQKYIPEEISFANEASFDTRVSDARKAFGRSAVLTDGYTSKPGANPDIAVSNTESQQSAVPSAPQSSASTSQEPETEHLVQAPQNDQPPTITEQDGDADETDKPWFKKYGKELAYGGAALTALTAGGVGVKMMHDKAKREEAEQLGQLRSLLTLDPPRKSNTSTERAGAPAPMTYRDDYYSSDSE